MSAPKGVNNFYSSKRKKMDALKSQIKSLLESFRKSKKMFKNFSEIADELCEEITEIRQAEWIAAGQPGSHPDPLVKSTLYRSVEYKPIIDSFLDSQTFKGSAKQPRVSAGDQISELQHELSNAKHENNRLRRYIENIGANQTPANTTRLPSAVENHDFIKTAQVVSLLLEASEGQFVLNEDGAIILMAKRVNNVLASADLTSPFRKWFKLQERFND